MSITKIFVQHEFIELDLNEEYFFSREINSIFKQLICYVHKGFQVRKYQLFHTHER